MSFTRFISRNLLQIPGWHTNRKLVIFESDDWGSIRIPSAQVYKKLLSRGIKLDKLAYNRYDSLASEEDLSYLFETLGSIKDSHGKSPVFTANTIVGNPAFDKILGANFSKYYFEPFTETLKKYPCHTNSFSLWKEGIAAGLFKPQFHGREHLNVNRWLKALQNNKPDVRLIFNDHMFDLSVDERLTENSFMDALNIDSEEDIMLLKQSISEGLDLFLSIFGYNSNSFVAPLYIWPNEIEETLHEKGVRFIQSAHYQLEPMFGIDHKFKKSIHYSGQISKGGLQFIVRNASFEPSEKPNYDWIDDVLAKAKSAFRFKKPLVISTHRVNYIGFIDRSNRERNLPALALLLRSLLKYFPDIEFLNTCELGTMMKKNKQNH